VPNLSLNWLCTLYDAASPLPEGEASYTKALLDADFLSNTPQIYHLLKEQGRLEQTPLFFQQRLKEMFKRSYYQNLFIKNQVGQVVQSFEEYEVDVIPLKGVFFAEKYFGHLGARITSDIDLLVKFEDLEKAIALVKSSGFMIEEEEIQGHFHLSFSKRLPGSEIPLTIEMHWDLVQESTASLPIEEFWEQSILMKPYTHVRVLSNYHTFYMICLHGWRHNLDSIKYYLDMIQLIHQVGDEIDYSALIKDADRHKTQRRLTRTLSILYQECPFLEKIKPFSHKDKRLYLSYEDKKEPSGKVFEKYSDFIDYQFFSYDTARHKVREVIHWLKSKG
jgi:hypothetical protein